MCPSGRCQVVKTSWLFRHGVFRTAYRVVWTAAGTFVPLTTTILLLLLLLFACSSPSSSTMTFVTFVPLTLLCIASAGLVAVLYRSRTAAVSSPRRYPCTRVTMTVTSVVLTFIVLVCPSMLLEVTRVP